MIGDVGRRCAVSTWRIVTPGRSAAAPNLLIPISHFHSRPCCLAFSTYEAHVSRYPYRLLRPQPIPANYYTRSTSTDKSSSILNVAAHTSIKIFPAKLREGRSTAARPLDRRKPVGVLQRFGRRSFHTSSLRRKKTSEEKIEGTGPHKQIENGLPKVTEGGQPRTRPPVTAKDETSSTSSHQLIDRLPNISNIHKPTKEELLAAATGFWSRLKVRFKWFSIRSARPFNADEIGAFVSWVLLGHVLWIILGTTTFFSLAILAVNTVFAQETLARWVGNYLTKSSGVKVVFESAIVPKWNDGVITFKNVFVSRRPGQGTGKVSKGSSTTAAAAAAAASRVRKSTSGSSAGAAGNEEEDGNYTQFDLSIDTVNVTLSFTKWFNSKGMLHDVEVKGVRGVIDRTHVHNSGDYIDPRSYKHEHNPGDFEIDAFKMEDLLVTVYQPRNFRPFSVSIFSCDLPRLRRQWLFYDLMSANMMSGSFDESLFTVHPRQIHGHAGNQFGLQTVENGENMPWKKNTRLRIDGLNIDHLNRGATGPLSWIHEGNVDLVADIMLPTDNDESIVAVVSNIYDQLEAKVVSNGYFRVNSTDNTIHNDIDDTAPMTPTGPRLSSDKRFIVMDLRVHLNDVRAAVPLFTKDLSYVNNALIRPIVAYINSRKSFIPINCRVVKRASDFDGSWTIFDSGLMDDLSAEVYEAFAKDVTDDQARIRRIKKVGLWSLQVAVQALFMGMAGSVA